jgi:hypothetical protein
MAPFYLLLCLFTRFSTAAYRLNITVIFCEMFFRYAMGAAMNAGDFFVRIKIAGK